MPIVGQFGSLAGLGSLILPGGAMESIATVTVGSGGAPSVEFTNIPSTYQHLQIRVLARSTNATTGGFHMGATLNGSTASLYTTTEVYGDGSTAGGAVLGGAAVDPRAYMTWLALSGSPTVFGTGIIDILDYSSTTKTKVARTLGGFDANGSGAVVVRCVLWNSTAAISSIQLFPWSAANFAQHSTFALYGLRAP